MKVFHQTLVAPGVACFFLVVTSLSSWWALERQNEQLDNVVQQGMMHSSEATEFANKLTVSYAHAYRSLTWTSAINDNRIEKDTPKILSDLKSALHEFDQFIEKSKFTPAELELLNRVKATAQLYEKSLATTLDMAGMDINTGVTGMQTVDEHYIKLEDEVRQLISLETQQSQAYAKAADGVLATSRTLTGVLFLIASACSLWVSLFLARRLTQRISQAKWVANRIAKRDLSADILDTSQDEIGDLNRALQLMQNELRHVLVDMNQNALTLRSVAGELKQSANSLQHSTDKQSQSINESAAAMEEMSSNVSGVVEHSRSAQQVAQETSNFAEQGQQVSSQASEEIMRVVSAVQTSAESMGQLLDSSSSITRFANLIQEITAQTNLLALNAAIEAARAGEQGRGFAVVADEVRHLAERTSAVTVEIKATIDSIQQYTQKVAEQMSEAKNQVERGRSMILELSNPLECMRSSALGSVQTLAELNSAILANQESSLAITESIEVLNQESQSTSEVAIQSVKLANHLNQVAEHLGQLVGQFKLNAASNVSH